MTRPTKTIADSARVPPVPTQDDITEDSRGKADAARAAKVAAAESPPHSILGRFFGEGEDARNWQIWIIAVAGVAIMTLIYCFARQDRHADLALTFLIQAFTAAVAFFVGGKTRRR